MRKISCFLSILCLYLLLDSAMAADNTTGTLAPPPPINLTNLFTLNYSTVDNRFIGSERIENLDLSLVTVNSTTNTNFRINFFNRSQATNLQNVSILNTIGNWSHLTSSKASLSCSLVFQSTNSTYALLRFANQTRFEIVFRGDKTKFPTQMSNMTNGDIQTKVVLGELCNILSFNQVAYFFNPSGNSTNTTWVPLNVPNPTLFQGGSPDFNFVVTNLTLYQLNITNNTYNQISKLPFYKKFDIRNAKNQVILIGSNFTTSDNVTYNVSQTLMAAVILFTPQGPQFKVISSDNITAEVKSPSIPVAISPQLTKVSFFFRPPPVNGTPSDPQIIIKSIDYVQQNFSNYTFQNISQFKDIMKNAQPNQLNIGDNFLLISNRSGLSINSSLPVAWYYYQYVAQNIVLLRKRMIPSNQTAALSSFLKADIDPTITNTMVVIESSNATNSIKFTQVDLGSLAANNRVLPPTSPPLVNFTIPTFTQKFPSQKSFDWVYLDSTVNSNASTQITTFNFNNTATNKIDKNNFTLLGNWTIFAQNKDCKFLSKVGTQNYTIFRFDRQTRMFTAFADVTTLLSNVTTTASKYLISLACDRFSVDNRIYSILPSNNTNNTTPTFSPVQNNLTQFNWTSSDDNLTTVIVNSSLWRFRPESNNSFVKIFDSPSPLFQNNKLYQLPGRIVVTGTNATSAQVFAFVDQNGTLNTLFNWTFTQYQNTPMIKVATNASKIMIVGPFIPPNSNQAIPKIDIFAIDYKNATFSNVSIPQNLNVDPQNVFINLQDRFLYARQLSNTANATGLQQFVFLFDQDLYLKPSIVTNLSQPAAGFTWKKTLVVNTPDNQFLVMQESQQTVNSVSYVIVNSRQVLANQSNLNTNNGGTQIAGTVVNGQIKLCPAGCNDCSSGTCNGCFPGYVLDSTAFTCLVCAPNCKTCSSSSTSTCYSCFERSYLNGTVCSPCSSSCTACNGSATSCSSCPPGQSFIGGNCTNCGPFCHNCSSSTVCITCIRGFTLTPNNTCRGCSSSCSSCNPANITQCTSCAKGLQLANGICVSCPNNCQQCNQGVCSTCFPGFQANSAGLCIPQCQPTCATCADNQPGVCLSCYSGANYDNVTKSCSLDLTCNSNSTCTDCGIGFNYILVGTTCMQCPNITSCIQCSSTDSSTCAMCMQGFYIDSGLCSSCNSTCMSCVSFQVCTSCVVGYTLPQEQSSGSCMKCSSPCLTCIGSSTSCSSCIDGFTKKGWKCLNNTYVGFSIVFNAEPTTVFNNIDSIVSSFLEMAKKVNSNVDLSSVTFDSFKQGSTIASGSVTGVGSSALTVGAGQTFGGITVSAASFTQYGTTTIDQPTVQENSKIGLYIGLGVGIPVAIAVIVIVSCIIYKKRKQAESVSPNNHVELNNLEPVKINDSQMVSAKDNVYNHHPKNPQQPLGSNQAWDKELGARH